VVGMPDRLGIPMLRLRAGVHKPEAMPWASAGNAFMTTALLRQRAARCVPAPPVEHGVRVEAPTTAFTKAITNGGDARVMTFLARSSTRCWNPPQVPKHGTRCSRAYWIAQGVLSKFL
jgi:hypothetical protein